MQATGPRTAQAGSGPLREWKRLKARVKKEEEDATVPHIKLEPQVKLDSRAVVKIKLEPHVKLEPGVVVKKEKEPLDIKPKPEAVSSSERRTRVLEAYQRIAAFSLDEPRPPGATATFLNRYKADFSYSGSVAHPVRICWARAIVYHSAPLCSSVLSALDLCSRSTCPFSGVASRVGPFMWLMDDGFGRVMRMFDPLSEATGHLATPETSLYAGTMA
jgi:hypothetical protein